MSQLLKKRIAFLVEDMYEELELWVPFYRMAEEGAECLRVAPDKSKTYKGKHGYPATIDLAIDAANAADFDAVVIPGGFAPDFMRRTPAMIEFVRQMHTKGKVIAAICHGVWIPASAGILKGKTATCFSAIQDDIRNAGATYVDHEVVRDRNLITARKPADLPAFCREIIAAVG